MAPRGVLLHGLVGRVGLPAGTAAAGAGASTARGRDDRPDGERRCNYRFPHGSESFLGGRIRAPRVCQARPARQVVKHFVWIRRKLLAAIVTTREMDFTNRIWAFPCSSRSAERVPPIATMVTPLRAPDIGGS